LLLTLFIFSCTSSQQKEETAIQPVEENTFGLVLPKHFPASRDLMKNNPVTRAGFELGRALFYDPLLSRDNTISCGSCHIQSSGFTHHGHDVSHGIDDQLGRRNTPAVQNILWQDSYFWDGGVLHIDLVPINAITNPVEMDESLSNVLDKLRAHPKYPSLFKKAFGSEQINSTRFLQALSQFMAMLISADSRYDKYLLGDKSVFSAQEVSGMQLFQQKCASCHAGVLLTDNRFRNNGITADFTNDKGRFEVSQLTPDIGKFRVPSLRNVAHTPPYMHAGQLTTLTAVLDHYEKGVKYSTALDSLLIKPDGSYGIDLTSDEKKDIISFLNTLSDETFIKNKDFSEDEAFKIFRK
jgi:cytochrome c peroxidase